MLSSNQIRAARALLGWSGTDLADLSGVGITTLRRYELQRGIPSANTSVLMMIKKCLFAIVCLFTASCASQKLEIKPINHVSTFLSHQAFDTLELVGDEIWLRKKGK